MNTITCLCGETILVVPDLKQMSKAIENHVNQHGKNPLERIKVRSHLSQQVLKEIGK